MKVAGKRRGTTTTKPRRDAVSGFQTNEYLEVLMRIRDQEPRRFSVFSEATRLSVEHYERAKARHIAEQGSQHEQSKRAA
jgi:hypothetical protein